MLRAGIDVGGTKLEIIVLDAHNQEMLRRRIPSPSQSYPAMLAAIVELLQSSEQALGCALSLGLGIPGTLSPDHGRVKNANSTCLIGNDLKGDLEQRLQRPVRIANDADCFAWSEYCDGAGRGTQSLFGVILGTGVGGGLVVNGGLVRGPNAIAGEWGHNPLPWPRDRSEQDTLCYCGRRGCIETFLSGPGMARRYAEMAGLSNDRCAPDAPQILQRAEQGESLARQCLEDYWDRLARGLASVINILDPEVIVLGGGLSNWEHLYQEIPMRWGQYVFSDRVNTQLRQAAHGDSSGVRGAAWLWPAASASVKNESANAIKSAPSGESPA